jgi:DNA-binding CsgD family transcriptional regulator
MRHPLRDEEGQAMKDEKHSESLSRREKDVVDLLMLGKSNKQIAYVLGISERTVEFHLNNVYSKFQVGSRTELILKLVEPTGGISANQVESTVDMGKENIHNGNQPTQTRAAQSLRNTVSLIRKEVAMTIRISFEELENYLRSHPLLFSLVLFLTASLTARIVVFGLGLFHWSSYALLGILLAAGSIYFGLSWNKVSDGGDRIQPLLGIIASAVLPLFPALFDQIYLQTVLRFTESTSVTIAGIYAEAGWLMSPQGHFLLYRTRQTGSDDLWLLISASMLLLFIISLTAGKRFKKNGMVTA